LNLLSYGITPKLLLSYMRPGVMLDDMELNPYAKFLDGRDPVEVFSATSARLRGCGGAAAAGATDDAQA
jgi:hypothetical protein